MVLFPIISSRVPLKGLLSRYSILPCKAEYQRIALHPPRCLCHGLLGWCQKFLSDLVVAWLERRHNGCRCSLVAIGVLDYAAPRWCHCGMAPTQYWLIIR